MAPGPTALDGLTDEELRHLLREHGSQAAAAASLGVAKSTLQTALGRRGISQSRPRARGRLTREALHAKLLPPNNCRVRQFLDSLDLEQLEIVEDALAYSKQDLPAPKLRELLVEAGYAEQEVPGVDAINAHRAGQRPCRCKG